MVINSTKLLERFPNIASDEVDLSISIVASKDVVIEVTFENDERTEEQKVEISKTTKYFACIKPCKVSYFEPINLG